MPTPPPTHARLKPEYAGEYFRDRGVSRDRFASYCRKDRDIRIGFNEKEWPALLDGKAVPYDLLVAFIEYAGDVEKLGKQHTFALIGEACDPPTPPVEEGTNTWEGGFPKLFGVRTRAFQIRDLAHCRSTGDITDACRLVMANVGRSHTKPDASDEEAVRAGEQVMARSLADYVHKVRQWWEFYPRCVMFATSKGRNEPLRRVGAAIVLPLTQTGHDLMAAGQLDDMAVTDQHLQYPSAQLHINAVAEARARSRSQRFVFGAAALHTLFYQAAMMMPEYWRDPGSPSPSILGFAGTETNTRRLAETGYADTGGVLPGTGKRIFRLASGQGLTMNLQYWAMYGLIRLYQAALVEERKLVDTPQ